MGWEIMQDDASRFYEEVSQSDECFRKHPQRKLRDINIWLLFGFKWLEEVFRQACEDEQQHKKKADVSSSTTEMNGQQQQQLTTSAADQSSNHIESISPVSVDTSNMLDENGVIKLIKRINPRLPASRIKMKIKVGCHVLPGPTRVPDPTQGGGSGCQWV